MSRKIWQNCSVFKIGCPSGENRKQAASTKRQAIFWHFPGYLDNPVIRGRDPEFRTRPVTVMRKGDWKIHLYHEEWLLDGGKDKIAQNNAVELYNLRTDEGERQNLANSNPQQRDDLLACFRQCFFEKITIQ